ncbi:TetR-like C-terminal domain-containing protein [Corynebacterium sp. H130]|uniref:TetR-like C-terminal domain-containing protein n=1 Tax=Corynebacterium sp. H130 TaxID=3133444 RepID=UPI0030B7BC6B
MEAREALAAALKSELTTTELSRITVARLAARAGVTRQAFYYHFDDVYDAAAWLFQEEVARHILAHARYDAWAAGFEQLMTYMFTHRDQVQAILKSLTMPKTEVFFFKALREMMSAIVTELADGHCLQPVDRDFIIDHYTLAVVGHLMHWIATGMREDPAQLAHRVEYVMRGHVAESIERYSSDS